MHWIQFWMCLKCIAVAWIFPSMRGRELLLCMHTSYRSAEHEANFNCLETSTCKECCYLRRSQYPYIFIFVTVFVGKWAKFGIFLCFISLFGFYSFKCSEFYYLSHGFWEHYCIFQKNFYFFWHLVGILTLFIYLFFLMLSPSLSLSLLFAIHLNSAFFFSN